jgi:hypothetical protein
LINKNTKQIIKKYQYHLIMRTFFLLLPVLAVLSICNNTYSQNLNRIFKNIKNDNINEAFNDVDKYNFGKNPNLIELNEFTIATYLIFSNEKFDECEPFEELTKFQQLEIPLEDKPKIEKFLKKYDYSFEIVLDIIYQNIVKFSKKQNTEAAYEKALSVCTPCNYSKELETLQEQAGYKEAKDKGTIYAYNSFLNKYENSFYRTEISELLEMKAFEETKKIKSLYSINDFISRYPKSKFIGEAIDFRDLLALPKEPMSFDAVNDYIKKYPNSKLISKLKLELPEILYNEVLSENTIEIYKKFIDIFPNDRRINELKTHLEISYVDILKEEFNIDDFIYFKKTFPNSQFLKELNIAFNEKKKNNDLARFRLKGEVKSIQTLVDGGKNGSVVVLFDSFGKLESINVGHFIYLEDEKVDQFEIINDPKVFDKEFNFFTLLGHKTEAIYCEYRGYRGWISPTGNASYIYNAKGNLISIGGTLDSRSEFIYDENNKLITKNSNGKVIKYKWNNNKLISKEIYTENGDMFDENYDIEYKNNYTTQVIKSYTRKGKYDYFYTLDYNSNGEVIRSRKERYRDDSKGYSPQFQLYYDKKYKYINGNLSEISTSTYKGYETDERYCKMYGVNPNLGIPQDVKNNTLIIPRDLQGNILKIGNTEFKYKYDEFNNWVLREEYDIKQGDIVIRKKIREISRKINYY